MNTIAAFLHLEPRSKLSMSMSMARILRIVFDDLCLMWGHQIEATRRSGDRVRQIWDVLLTNLMQSIQSTSFTRMHYADNQVQLEVNGNPKVLQMGTTVLLSQQWLVLQELLVQPQSQPRS